MAEAHFPWREMMGLGLGVLRLPPEIFWQMTLPELAAAAYALNPKMTSPHMTRNELDLLMKQFPD